ncbi:ATP-binding cassette domain-containing protein [Micromonospora sp. CA-240977]|uniref:ABC transporter ATP-binding protein n=1 Tax=Micromonospora sp. CA-240977 TaxID=3239957 RepID=UPI003D92614E
MSTVHGDGTTAAGNGIRCVRLTKRFSDVVAVDDLSFDAPMGAVTGFVGANGAGKTTTMRMLLGLVQPTSGEALIDGRWLRDIPNPRLTVGTVLDSPGAHPGHTARAYLGILARASGVPQRRIAEVLDMVGLGDSAQRRVGAFSLGMKQRLSLAAGLLGDPRIIMLDEPTKGLDPPGMLWLRGLLRDLAAEGRCVFLSSHHLAELDAIADHVVVLHKGRLIAKGGLSELMSRRGRAVVVRSAHNGVLEQLVRGRGGSSSVDPNGGLRVVGLTAPEVGELALAGGVAVHHLSEERAELEDIFLELTASAEDKALERVR